MRDIDVDKSDRDRLIGIINTLQENLVDFENHQDYSLEEYMEPENRMLRKAIRETFIETVEACVQAIDALLGYVVDSRPQNRKEKFKLAYEEEIINYDLKEDMLSAVGFRDVLAHKYGAIIDHTIVYEAYHEDIDKYRKFKQILEDYTH